MPLTTAQVIDRFNHVFEQHDPDALDAIIGEGCVMEAVQPAPDGARYEGREDCLRFWRALAEDRTVQFAVEDVAIAGDRSTILWRCRFGDTESVRGVTLVRLREGRIVEALGYSKTGGEGPLNDEILSA